MVVPESKKMALVHHFVSPSCCAARPGADQASPKITAQERAVENRILDSVEDPVKN